MVQIDPCEWDFNKKCTSLHCAAAAGDIACIKCLIESGADVNAGLSAKSPLYYAVLSNAGNCVEALLQAGASPNNPQVCIHKHYLKYLRYIANQFFANKE